MVDNGALTAIGATIVGFGIVAFVFRVQRELEMRERSHEQRELRHVPPYATRRAKRGTGRSPSWIPWADRLLIGTVTAAILLVLFPIALAGSASSFWGERLPAAACSGSAIALAGYIPALLAHYRFGFSRPWFWFGEFAPGGRENPEPAERAIVIASAVLGVAAAVGSFFLTS
jgi:hypothetical protein